MNKIIPSIYLKCLSVHKMKTLSCLRRYFYERVLNLQSNRVIMPFWYGGILHVGWQSLLLGYDTKETLAAMQAEHTRRSRGCVITADDKQEMQLQFDIICALVFTGFETRHVHWRPDKIELEWAEDQICWPVPGFAGLVFCSTLDGYGTVRGGKSLLEIKSAKMVSDDYFASLEFEMQPCSYVLGHQKDKGNGANRCLYMVFRKPQIRIKQTETPDDFAVRLKADLLERPSHYFVSHSVALGANAVKHAQENIIATAELLSDRYLKLSQNDGILKARNWPQNTEHCYYYAKPCPFTMLCRYGGDPTTFMGTFRQREMLYEAEKKELAE